MNQKQKRVLILENIIRRQYILEKIRMYKKSEAGCLIFLKYPHGILHTEFRAHLIKFTAHAHLSAVSFHQNCKASLKKIKKQWRAN